MILKTPNYLSATEKELWKIIQLQFELLFNHDMINHTRRHLKIDVVKMIDKKIKG